MSAPFTKLQPDRTFYLRGFDGFGANAAIHNASPAGFTVSGVFRAADDFAVLVLYDADDFYGHPLVKWLPDFAFDGMVLEFDLAYSGLQCIDSPKYATIDWPYLDVITEAGSTAQVSLLANATLTAGSHSPAQGVFTVTASSPTAGTTLTLWFLNIGYQYTCAGGDTATTVAGTLAGYINATNWSVAGGIYQLTAVASGPTITLTANPAGADGNMITMYSVASNPSTLSTAPVVPFSGGSSTCTWHVKLDFSGLGIAQIRQMWLTFAPALASGAAYQTTTWDATFSNWGITADPNGRAALEVSGANSVRVEETDAWCVPNGTWTSTNGGGFYSQGFALESSTVGDSVTVSYWCGATHNLWLGTALYSDRAQVSVTVDGATQPTLDTYLSTSEPIVTRRQVASGLATGHHVAVFQITGKNSASSGTNFYFDFIEASIPTALPAPLPALADLSPAIDYDTQHGYQLAPARLMWMFDQLGFAGEMNEYVGVFWWNQRVAEGGSLASATVTFGSTWAVNDAITLTISGAQVGKTILTSGETGSTIAAHMAYSINETFSGIWASATGGVLTVTVRAASAAYQVGAITYSKTSTGGTVSVSGTLSGSVPANWIVDPTQVPVMNYGAAAWHADLYTQAASRGVRCTSSFSLEIVNPPDNPPGAVWACRYPDGTAVETATGFSTLVSTQCVLLAPQFLAYQQQAFLYLAHLQAAAGIVPSLQCGEFLWWYFANASGMAYYDAVTNAAALSTLGRPLHTFLTPHDAPGVNGGADAAFLAARLASHVSQIVSFVQAAYPNATFEVLFPYDVNYPTVYGPYNLGGPLNNAVNLPAAWKSPAGGSGLARIKIEALDFGSGTRTLDQVQQALSLFVASGWPVASLRYLFAVDNGGCPWQHELALARWAQYSHLTPWAMDHICLFGWRLDKRLSPSSVVSATE